MKQNLNEISVDCFHKNIDLETVLKYAKEVIMKYPDYDFEVALTTHYHTGNGVSSETYNVDDNLKRNLSEPFCIFDDIDELEYPISYTLFYFYGTKK